MVAASMILAKTPRGRAGGFKIEVIEKCADLKSQDNQSNLLAYIIDKTEKSIMKDIVTEERTCTPYS